MMNKQINVGDVVAYQDNIFEYEFLNLEPQKNPVTVTVEKYGIWNGKCVQLNDKERTTVRKLDWLYIPENYSLEVGKFKLIKTFGRNGNKTT